MQAASQTDSVEQSSDTNPNLEKKYFCTKYDIFILGITIVIGGQYFSWNAGLSAGLGSFLIATFLIGSYYYCLCLCLSELSSALPFAGGAYGLARCTLGFYFGYIVGCCESLEYVCYVALSATSLAANLSSIFPDFVHYQPIIWLAFYVSALVIHIFVGKNFWRFNYMVGAISLMIILMYCLGSLHYVDITRYSPIQSWFNGGIYQFVEVIPLPCWFFVGIESLNMACDDVSQPRKEIPWAQILCITVLNITGFMVLIVSASLPGGTSAVMSDLTPLNRGINT